jgi:hypothetical protein
VNNFITPGFQDQISAACILNIGFACALYNTCQVKKAGFFQPALSLFNLPVDQRYFLILQFMPSIRFPYSDGDREPGIRYCGRSAELVFRLRITFSAAVIVVDFLHHGMVGSPVERRTVRGDRAGGPADDAKAEIWAYAGTARDSDGACRILV